MSRLLFAAARGAKIQALDKNLGAILSSHAPLELSNDKRPYRIHPDDANLAYGPITTALRKSAESFGARHTSGLPYVEGYFVFTDAEADCFDADELHRSLFLLILAEALADEGM